MMSTHEVAPVAYATPIGGSSATGRLATLLVAALGFMFLGGCFCIGILYLIAVVPRFNAAPGQWTSTLTAGQVALTALLSVMAIACFIATVGLILAAFRFDRATR
jgi:hypothetical protein